MGQAFASEVASAVCSRSGLKRRNAMISGRTPAPTAPLAPVVQVGFEFEMDETIPQRTRHREMDTPLGGRIAGGDDHPAIRQHILSEFAVEHQLVTTGLRHLRRRRQFIEKENALPGSGKELGRHPLGLVCFDPGQPAQINRIELHGAHIEEVDS